eukprot:UN1991
MYCSVLSPQAASPAGVSIQVHCSKREPLLLPKEEMSCSEQCLFIVMDSLRSKIRRCTSQISL